MIMHLGKFWEVPKDSLLSVPMRVVLVTTLVKKFSTGNFHREWCKVCNEIFFSAEIKHNLTFTFCVHRHWEIIYNGWGRQDLRVGKIEIKYYFK